MDAKQILIKRVSDLIAVGQQAINATGSELFSSHKVRFRAQSLSFIESLNGTSHPNYSEFEMASRFNYASNVRNCMELLHGIKQDIENDYYLSSIRGLVSAEIFSDYLEMAEYLLSENYYTPAAVIIGSTLEEHLRGLCQKKSLPINFIDSRGKTQLKAASDLNNTLYKATMYNKVDQSLVDGWIKIRNAAAHGNHSEYTKEQVTTMLSGVKDFVGRHLN